MASAKIRAMPGTKLLAGSKVLVWEMQVLKEGR